MTFSFSPDAKCATEPWRHHKFTALLILCSAVHLLLPTDGRGSPTAHAWSALTVLLWSPRSAGRL